MLVALAEMCRLVAAVFECIDMRLMTVVQAAKVCTATVQVVQVADLTVPSVLLLFLLVQIVRPLTPGAVRGLMVVIAEMVCMEVLLMADVADCYAVGV
jgi:hypothetical protein